MLVDFTNGDRIKQQEIIMKLGDEELLCQLAEECCELAQASLKVRRAIEGTTPVTKYDAIQKLNEETGDVLLLIDCLKRIGVIQITTANEIARKKLSRWHDRTFKR